MIPSQEKNLIWMFRFQLEQVVDVLFRVMPPVHIVPEKDNPVRFLKVAMDNLLSRFEISMGVPNKDGLSLAGELDQPRFLLQ
jgi:hypothetical protein